MKLLEHVPGRGHVRVDGALVGETDQVVVDMLPGVAGRGSTAPSWTPVPSLCCGTQTTYHKMPGSMSQANIETLQII